MKYVLLLADPENSRPQALNGTSNGCRSHMPNRASKHQGICVIWPEHAGEYQSTSPTRFNQIITGSRACSRPKPSEISEQSDGDAPARAPHARLPSRTIATRYKYPSPCTATATQSKRAQHKQSSSSSSNCGLYVHKELARSRWQLERRSSWP